MNVLFLLLAQAQTPETPVAAAPAVPASAEATPAPAVPAEAAPAVPAPAEVVSPQAVAETQAPHSGDFAFYFGFALLVAVVGYFSKNLFQKKSQ